MNMVHNITTNIYGRPLGSKLTRRNMYKNYRNIKKSGKKKGQFLTKSSKPEI